MDDNVRSHEVREHIGHALEYITRIVHTVTPSLSGSDGKTVGRPPLHTFLTGALTGVSNSIGALKNTMETTLHTHGSWEEEASVQRKTAAIDAFDKLVADCRVAAK